MYGKILLFLVLGLTAQPLQAFAMHWMPAPAAHGKGHGGHDRNAAKGFTLVDGEGATLSMINPQLNVKPLTANHGMVAIKPTGMNNYHVLVATRTDGTLHESAIRYIFMHGKPSGESPSLLIKHEKAALEIEPAPLAREHWRYYSGIEARFILRFQGKPLAASVVTLTTGNGTHSSYTTDAEGGVTLLLPEDFADVKSGRMNNKPAEFLLAAKHGDNGQTYVTTFASGYYVNPDAWQSTSLGLYTMVGAMLLAGVITFGTRRRKEKS